MRDIVVFAPGRDTVVWITPQELRRIAYLMESKAARNKCQYGSYTIGTKKSGQVNFRYRNESTGGL